MLFILFTIYLWASDIPTLDSLSDYLPVAPRDARYVDAYHKVYQALLVQYGVRQQYDQLQSYLATRVTDESNKYVGSTASGVVGYLSRMMIKREVRFRISNHRHPLGCSQSFFFSQTSWETGVTWSLP